MSDLEKPEYGWETFKGTRNEWAWWWLDFHYLHYAKENDDISEEIFCAELKATKKERDALQSQLTAANASVARLRAEFLLLVDTCEWYANNGTEQERHHFLAVEARGNFYDLAQIQAPQTEEE
jgi:hypothetical protein